MTSAVIGALVVVAAIGYGCFSLGRWVASKWLLVRLWRWFSGQAHHGYPVTDAGWFRKGEKPLTRTGHATKWWHRPRWQRAVHRTGGTLAVFVVVLAFLANWKAAALALGAVLLAGTGFGVWAVRRWARMRTERREALHPAHLALHATAGHPRALPAGSWISTQRDGAGAVLSASFKFPAGWPADGKDEQWFVETASKKLAIESAVPSWRRDGPVPLLVLRHSPPPPGYVAMESLLPELGKLREHELLVGVGKDEELIKVSLDTDAPHAAITAGTGGTKSNVSGWLLLQLLLRGSIGLILDAKRRLSYPWILKDMDRNLSQLPNIAYAWTTQQLHDGMCWMSEELDRRGDVAFAAQDTTGQIHGNVGPRQITIAEELNLSVPRLKLYWAQNKQPGDPAKSPAFTGLGEDAFAGREVRKHLFLVGQFLTAEVTGSKDSSVRSQCGIKMLSRYDEKLWQMMCGRIPMPPPPTALGRFQVVTAEGVREVQTPKLDRIRAREMALAGTIGELPSTVPLSLVTGIPAVRDMASSPADVTGSEPVPVIGAAAELMALKEIVNQGRVRPATTLASLKMARFRDPQGFPEDKGRRGQTLLYDPQEVQDYDMARG